MFVVFLSLVTQNYTSPNYIRQIIILYGEEEVFIYYNATKQSAIDERVFTTPDIVKSKTDKPMETNDYYTTKKTLSYIPKESLISFCEAKLNLLSLNF